MRWVWILFLAITPVWAEPPVRQQMMSAGDVELF